MSEVTPKSDPFKDYCTADNTDDEETNNDLQARLYAEIYYQTNIDGELGTKGTSSIDQPSSGLEKSLTEPNKQTQNRELLQLETIELKSSTYHNTLHAGSIVNPQVSIDIRESHLTEQAELVANTFLETDRGNLIDLETIGVIDSPNCDNSAIDKNDNTNIITATGPTLTRGKSSQESSSNKHKSFKQSKYKRQKKLQQDIVIIDDTNIDTKYMVLQKREKQEKILINKSKQASQNSSDSEESIFEVPVPPKPLPPVINLQDSDNEDATSSTTEEDDPLANWCDKNANSRASSEVEIVEMRAVDDQDAYTKIKITNQFLRNKNTTKYGRSGHDMHNVSEDIVLNCTTVQKGAKNISEIKQLSKNVEMEQKRQRQMSVNQDMSRNPKAKSLPDVSRANGETNTTRIVQQNSNKIDVKRNTRNVMLRRADQDLMDNTSVEISFENSLVMNRKRHGEVNSEGEKNNDSTQKRQCTIISRQDNQNAALTLVRNSKMAERRKIRMNWNEYFFKPMSEELRRFYSDSRGQENFDIRELQRKMSKNPRMWAILDEDLMPSPGRRGSRYWSTVRCNYCQREGHLRKDCPEPPRMLRCYMCGEPGHTDKRCPYKVCLTCGKKQNSFRKTCEHCRTFYCTMCSSIGHRMMQCPDLWRRYHHTTTETGCLSSDPGDVMKPANQLHCCNCTRRGHEASSCTEYRWSLHFTTPATVTSYTEGPLYISNTIANEASPKTANVSSNRTGKNDRTSISQKPRGIPETNAHVKYFLNVDTLQQANAPVDGECTSKTNEYSVPPFNMQSPFIASLTKGQKKGVSNNVTKLYFTTIIFSYGSCHSKQAIMLVRNLGPQYLHSLDHKTDFSVFLDRLQEIVNFEVIIGNLYKNNITLQLITLNEYIYPLFYLLLYWLGLPQDEKYYGLDLNLPTNPMDMFYLMTLKKKKLSMKNDSDPIKLSNEIDLMKAQLNREVQDSEQYFHLQRHIWDLQIKLVIFFNIKPERSHYVHNFWKYFNFLDKARKANNNLDIWLYLEIILTYNHLFVPHTPCNLPRMIRRFKTKQKKANKLSRKEKCKQNKVALSTKANLSCEPQPQNNLHKNFIRIVDIQNEDQNTFVKTRSLNILPGGSGATKSNAESFQNTTSLNTKPMSVQSEDENYLSLNSVNTASNLQTVQPNASEGHTKSYSWRPFSKIMDTWNLKLNELKSIKPTDSATQALQRRARRTVREARMLKIPDITRMVDDLKRKITNETIKQHHIDTLQRLIALELKKKNKYNSYLQ